MLKSTPLSCLTRCGRDNFCLAASSSGSTELTDERDSMEDASEEVERREKTEGRLVAGILGFC